MKIHNIKKPLKRARVGWAENGLHLMIGLGHSLLNFKSGSMEILEDFNLLPDYPTSRYAHRINQGEASQQQKNLEKGAKTT